MTNNLSFTQNPSAAKVALAKHDVQFLATDSYNESSRIICHAIKDNNMAAIIAAAYEMADCLPSASDVVLVPAPSRKGYATNTLLLADMIAKISGAEVADVLKGRERASNYLAKKEGHPLNSSDMSFYLTDNLPEGKVVVFVDNVVDTGATAFAAASVLGSCVVLSYAMTNVLF